MERDRCGRRGRGEQDQAAVAENDSDAHCGGDDDQQGVRGREQIPALEALESTAERVARDRHSQTEGEEGKQDDGLIVQPLGDPKDEG